MTTLLNANAAAGVFTATGASGLGLYGIEFDEVAPSAGIIANLSGCDDAEFVGCSFNGHACQIKAANSLRGAVLGCYFNGKAGTTDNLELSGTSKSWSVSSSTVTNVNSLFATLSGSGLHSFVGINSATTVYITSTCTALCNKAACPSVAVTALSPYMLDLDLVQYRAHNVAGGGSVAPDLSGGQTQFLISATSAGIITVDAPVTAPLIPRLYVFGFNNVGGGAITWSMNAIYHLAPIGAPAAIDGTDGRLTVIGFLYAGGFREAFRTVTT